jgi:hypothetical protein
VLYGLTIGRLPKEHRQLEGQVWQFIYAMRDAVRRKHGYDSDDDLTLPQVSLMDKAARAYLRERMLEAKYNEDIENGNPPPRQILEEIRKAATSRHTALIALGISEKESGTDLRDWAEDEEEE